MVFVRYIHDGNILDDFLFCRGLTSKTTAHDVLKVVSDFFTTEGLTLYDPGGWALKAPHPIFCSHAFNFGAALLCVGDFSQKIV